MHERGCKCDYCQAYANIPWVELTLRVLCPKCKTFAKLTDRIHQGVHWEPAVKCPTCGFIEIVYASAGQIGVNAVPPLGERKGTQ